MAWQMTTSASVPTKPFLTICVLDARSRRGLVHTRPEALDMDAVGEDVRPFLERPQDAGLLTRENLAGLLRE